MRNTIPQIGDLVLRKRSLMVKHFSSPTTRNIIKKLITTMRRESLVGMAAPQLGYSVRVFVTEVRRTKTRDKVDTDQLRVFINPRIIKYSFKKDVDYEGCGSVASAGLFGLVRRPTSVSIVAYDDKGEKFKLTTTGLLSRVIQHEMDHLNGELFVDKITSPESLMSKENYLAYRRGKR